MAKKSKKKSTTARVLTSVRKTVKKMMPHRAKKAKKGTKR